MKANLTIDCIEEIPTRVIQSLDKKYQNETRFVSMDTVNVYTELVWASSVFSRAKRRLTRGL